jgi:hypothetical protein
MFCYFICHYYFKMEENSNTDDALQDEAKAIALGEKIRKENVAFRDQIAKKYKYKECEEAFDGNQWKESGNLPVWNKIFEIIETEASILTESMPGVTVLTHNEDKEEETKILGASIKYTLDANNFDLKLQKAVRKSLISSNYFYIDYDPDKENGMGLSTITRKCWRNVALDPNALDDIDEASNAYIGTPLRVDLLKRLHPESADRIKPEKISMNDMDNSENAHESYDQRSDDSNGGDSSNSENMAMLHEVWTKDYTMVSISEDESIENVNAELEDILNGETPEIGQFENHQFAIEFLQNGPQLLAAMALQINPQELTEQDFAAIQEDENFQVSLVILADTIEMHETFLKTNPKGEKPKYKNFWRLIIWTGKVLHYDGPPPVNDNMIPLVQLICYPDDKSINSYGEVYNLLHSQRIYNESKYAIHRNIRMKGDPILVNKNTGIESKDINNEAGEVLTIDAEGELFYLVPPQVGADQFRATEGESEEMSNLSGVNKPSQGVSPGANASARLARNLTTQAIGRIRSKSRILEGPTMERLGKLIASRTIKYWGARKIKIKEGGKTKYTEYKPEDMENMFYEIEAVPATSSGFDKEAIEIRASEMLAAQQITFKQYLQITDLPFKARLLRDLDDNDEIETQMQQLSAQLEKLTMDNLKLKAAIDPTLESFSNEEKQMLETIKQEEINEAMLQQGEEILSVNQ